MIHAKSTAARSVTAPTVVLVAPHLNMTITNINTKIREEAIAILQIYRIYRIATTQHGRTVSQIVVASVLMDSSGILAKDCV
jgi:cellobiose-specific phosphotransferase system component IIB